jgi:5-methylcytosine-specific restriction endonuclease McrA
MGCLALNASFEPLTIVSPRRAIRLVLEGKAELLEVDGTRVFRSQRSSLPAPQVIRLVRFVHVPRRFRRQVTNTFLFARDNYACQYCGRHRLELRGREFLTRDHICPTSRGGGNTWDNVVTSCSPCNNRKGNRLPREAGMRLLSEPKQPNYVHLAWAVRRVTPTQAKYIRMFYGSDALSAIVRRKAEAVDVAEAADGAGDEPTSWMDSRVVPGWGQSSSQAYGRS